MSSRCARTSLRLALGLCGALTLAPTSAIADEAKEDAARRAISGVERPAREPGDTARDVADVLLFVPREFVELTFLGTAVAAGVIENEQVVPRVQDWVETPTPGGRILVFPTAFVETGRPLNVGARMIAEGRSAATSVRAGFGGVNETVVESRLVFNLKAPVPSALSFELLHQRQDDLSYLGVGQSPRDDPRNQFRAPTGGGVIPDEALYSENRARALVGLGYALSDDVHVLLSTSLGRRRIDDADDAGPRALSRVFEAGSVPGALTDSWIFYSESALRVDTRATRGRPSPGVLMEAYAGPGRDASIGPEVSFFRVGGRAAGFIPVVRRTNILSPALYLDGLVALGGLPVPFTELPRQPDFRGIDDRRDRVSLVGGLDYRWLLANHVGALLFADAATVADALGTVDLSELRFAGGFGLDLHTDSAELARVAISASPDGARLLLSLGVSQAYGDRQHRE